MEAKNFIVVSVTRPNDVLIDYSTIQAILPRKEVQGYFALNLAEDGGDTIIIFKEGRMTHLQVHEPINILFARVNSR